MRKVQKSVGRHIVADLWGCNSEYLDDVSIVQDFMNKAAREADATVLNSTFHTFQPHGVSGAVIIAESHLAIHTWSELGLASIDIYTCGAKADPWAAFKFLKKSFQAKKYTVLELKRGIFEADESFELQENYREQKL
ncbi:MAG: adenosylmethionine decarboxylase [Elusimicrobia bacterium CG08_land_8_20_14_0_20_44_26]|nr:MAG: adenosylmethionine decarboxylase [Elusimicrobia bacterium CG08_land_8_20_14_0_20_44_26]